MNGREPMDPELEQLLGMERGVDELDSGRRARVARSVSAAIGVPLALGGPHGSGGGPGGDGGGGGGGAAPGTVGAAATTTATATAAHGGLAGIKLAAALTAALGLGAGVGIGVDRAVLRTDPIDVAAPSERPRAPAVASGVEAPSTAAAESASATASAPSDVVPPPPPSAPRAATKVSAKGLAAERALLDVARGALARGEPAVALDATERHAREYPSGTMAEERDAMRVKALAELGRTAEARSRATEFERRYPDSLQLRAVRAAAGE